MYLRAQVCSPSSLATPMLMIVIFTTFNASLFPDSWFCLAQNNIHDQLLEIIYSEILVVAKFSNEISAIIKNEALETFKCMFVLRLNKLLGTSVTMFFEVIRFGLTYFKGRAIF